MRPWGHRPADQIDARAYDEPSDRGSAKSLPDCPVILYVRKGAFLTI